MENLKMCLENQRLKNPNLGIIFQKFKTLNQLICYQSREIKGYNRFWSIYLTYLISNCIIMICFFAYCLLYIKSNISLQTYFIVFMLEYACLLFAVLGRCSQVDSLNSKFYQANLGICFGVENLKSKASICNLLYVSCFVELIDNFKHFKHLLIFCRWKPFVRMKIILVTAFDFVTAIGLT